jgi:hypothetical protein
MIMNAQPAAAARPGGVGRGRPSLANSPHRKLPLPRIKRGAGPHSRILRIGRSPMLIAPPLRKHHHSKSKTEW